ncbi:MAG: MTH1187 family thiamine-binding protein [Magnetococcales bacterium]|nr:MTH1187 family thiamine-binding protein [Magnetococcales bacterium]
MSVLLEFSMTPLDKGESVSKYVSRSLDIIDKSGVSYRLGPMGTCLEGEYDEVMSVVKSCLDKMQSDCKRVSVSIKMDVRDGASDRLSGKIASVEKNLGRQINK